MALDSSCDSAEGPTEVQHPSRRSIEIVPPSKTRDAPESQPEIREPDLTGPDIVEYELSSFGADGSEVSNS